MGYAINSNMKKFAQSAQQAGKTNSASGAKASAAGKLKRSTTNKNFALNMRPNVAARRSGISAGAGRIDYSQYRLNTNYGLENYRPMMPFIQPQQQEVVVDNSKSFWEELIEVGGAIAGALLSGSSKSSSAGSAGSSSSGKSASSGVTSSETKASIDDLTKANNSAEIEQALEGANQQAQQLEQSLSGKTEKGLENAVNEKKQAVNDKKTKQNKCKENKKAKEKEATSYKQKKDAAQRQVDKLGTQITNIDQEIAKAQANNTNGVNNSLITSLEQKKADLEEQKEKLKQDIQKYEEKQEAAEKEAEELGIEIENNEKEIENLDTELKTATSELEQFKSANADLKVLKQQIKSNETRKIKVQNSEKNELSKIKKDIEKIDEKLQKAADNGKTEKYDELSKEREEKVKRQEELEGILGGSE